MLTPPARKVLLAALAPALAAAVALSGSTSAQEVAPDTTGTEVSESPADTTAAPAAEPRRDAPAVPETGESSGTGGESRLQSDSELSVLRAYVCRGIEQSEPTEAGKSFIPASDGVLHLCCFSEIGGPAVQDTVVHVWYWGDREMARVRLGVRGPRWRTWSTKQVLDEWRGEWRIDITDRYGALLSSLGFSVE